MLSETNFKKGFYAAEHPFISKQPCLHLI